MAISFDVEGQALKPSSDIFIASGTLRYPEVIFNFDNDWTGFGKIATFCTVNTELYRVNVVDDKCVIPAEVMLDDDIVHISVYGTKGNTRITTNIVKVYCHKSGYGTGIIPDEPTADIITQIQQEILSIKSDYLSKEAFRTQIRQVIMQLWSAVCIINYDGNYLGTLSGFRIAKASYDPTKSDKLLVWVNNELLTPNSDYVVTDGDEDYWELKRIGTDVPGMYLTVQIWHIPTGSTATTSTAYTSIGSLITDSIVGTIEEDNDE